MNRKELAITDANIFTFKTEEGERIRELYDGIIENMLARELILNIYGSTSLRNLQHQALTIAINKFCDESEHNLTVHPITAYRCGSKMGGAFDYEVEVIAVTENDQIRGWCISEPDADTLHLITVLMKLDRDEDGKTFAGVRRALKEKIEFENAL